MPARAAHSAPSLEWIPHPSAHPRVLGESGAHSLWLSPDDCASRLSCAVHSARCSLRLPDIFIRTSSFSLSYACGSADVWHLEVALWSESVCRVEWLSRPRVALARTAGLYDLWRLVSDTGPLHMLSIPPTVSKPSGSLSRAQEQAVEIGGEDSGVKNPMWATQISI